MISPPSQVRTGAAADIDALLYARLISGAVLG